MHFLALLLVVFGFSTQFSAQALAETTPENPNNQVLANGKMAKAFAEILLQAKVPESKFQDDPQTYYILEEIRCEDGPEKISCQAKVGEQLIALSDAETLHGLLGLFEGAYNCEATGKPEFPELCTTAATMIACTESKEITDILNRYVCLIVLKETTQPSSGQGPLKKNKN